MTRPVKSTNVRGVTPKPKPEVEVGVSLHLPFVTPYKNAWEILRDDEITVKQLMAMRKTDGQARALYRLITLPIRAALKTATFVPESQVEGGEEEAEFIEQMFTLPANAGGMVVPFNRIIAQMLMAIFDGFSAFEQVYWVPKTGPLKGKLTLKKLAHRPSDTLTFLLDRDGEFVGLRQRTHFQGREIDETIEADNVCYYAANEEERPFYGESYFQAAYYHWDKKFKLYVISHLACQRAAVGTRVGKMPANPTREEKLAFQKSLADLGVAQWMTIPDSYEVESLKEGPNFDFLAYINHHNSQMSKSILAAFFDDNQGSGGDTTLVDFGRQSDALFLLMLQTIMGEVEEVINTQVIPKFIDWNFSSGKYPRFQFGSLSQEQKNAVLELFKTLSVAGQSLTITPQFIHEMEKVVAEEFGLEIDYETIEEEMAAQKEAEELAQQAMPPPGAPGEPGAAGGPPAGPGGPPAGPGGGQPAIPPSIVPEGFTLLSADPDGAQLALTDLARDLLDEAYLELARGPLRGPRVVRTQQGASYYGEPVGTRIQWNQEQATAKEGVKGGTQGGFRGKNRTSGGGGGDKNTGRQVLGGGRGAPADNLGNVVTHPGDSFSGRARRYAGNPAAPGAVLIEFDDGTVAIRDANGNFTPRQKFDASKFSALGWQFKEATDDPQPQSKAAKRAASQRAGQRSKSKPA